MKPIGLIALASVLLALPIYSQTVNIPDANFLNALIALGVDTNGDSMIGYAEAEAVTYLDVGGGLWDLRGDIVDMTGIQAFVNLDTLKCNHNKITSLDVSNNTKLIYLFCMANELTALDVSNLPHLVHLDLDLNQVENLDVSKNDSLKLLWCRGNLLSRLDLSNCHKLEELYCYNNQLTSLDVSNNTALEYLLCSDNQALGEVCVWTLPFPPEGVNVSAENCPTIYFTTDCHYNNDSIVFIPDAAFLEALIDLGVDTSGDDVISIDEADGVWALDISDRGITDLTGLQAFMNLDTLLCAGNPLQRLELSHLSGLKYLDCRGCGLDELDVSECNGLEGLLCGDNLFTSLDLSGSNKLKLLDMSNIPDLYEVCVWETPFPPEGVEVRTGNSPKVRMTDDCSIMIPDTALLYALIEEGVDANGDSLINKSEAVATTVLEISGYGICDLTGLEAFTNLRKLECLNNPLCWWRVGFRIDLSDLPQLEYLDFSGSPIGTIDISGNPLLTTLICRASDLNSLVVTGNPELSYLDCAGNNLYKLNISENLALTYLDISNMPSLGEVCVWTIPFPPPGIEVKIDNSYNIGYEGECNMFRDRFEENDIMQEAVPLYDNRIYEDLAVSELDGDWYELAPLGASLINSLTVRCRFVHAQGDINIDIVGADGNILARATSKTDDEIIVVPMNPLESYYLYVHLDSGRYSPYSLSWISNVYAPNSSLKICTPDEECLAADIDPSHRDTSYIVDTLFAELYAGDLSTAMVSIQNMGPDPYAFYSSLDCSRAMDENNYAVRFDGANDYIEIFRSPFIDLKNEITLEAWIWFEEGEEGSSPIISRCLNGYGYELYSFVDNAGIKVGFMVNGKSVVSKQSIEARKWYHVAATYNSKWIRLYINGIIETEIESFGSISIVNQSLIIGSNSPMDLYPRYFKGEIDEIRIWNLARKAVEIQCSYQQLLNGNEKGLAGCWNLNEKMGNHIIDLTGNNRGIISGEALRVSSSAPVGRMITVHPFSGMIPDGSAFTLQVEFNALDLSGGDYEIDINLFSNNQAIPDITIPTHLKVLDAPAISVYPENIDFGEVEIYRTSTLMMEISNHGNEVLYLDSIRTDMNGTRISPAICSIEPGETRSLRLDAFFRFEGSHTGTLSFISNDPSDPQIEIPISAEAHGISMFALLRCLDDTIPRGLQKIYGLNFKNNSNISALTMTHSLGYLSPLGILNDRFFKPVSGNWIAINLPEIVILPPGESTSFYVLLDASDLEPGDYWAEFILEWYNPFYVKGFVPIRLHVKAPVGIEPLEEDMSDVMIYPNPTFGMVTLHTLEQHPYSILLTSLAGQILQVVEVSKEDHQMDLSFLARGIYLITVKTKDSMITRRIVKL